MIMECFYLGNKQIISVINRNVGLYGEVCFEGNDDFFLGQSIVKLIVFFFLFNIKGDLFKYV